MTRDQLIEQHETFVTELQNIMDIYDIRFSLERYPSSLGEQFSLRIVSSDSDMATHIKILELEK